MFSLNYWAYIYIYILYCFYSDILNAKILNIKNCIELNDPMHQFPFNLGDTIGLIYS